MRNLLLYPLTIAIAAGCAFGQHSWRQATTAELRDVIPARAQVEKEKIETESKTASGVTDGAKFIAGAVLITTGYAAEGKYSRYLTSQTAIKVGDATLKPGEYVVGSKHDGDNVVFGFYEAATGKEVAKVNAHRISRSGKVEEFAITPPDHGTIAIGRFAVDYALAGK